MLCPGSYHMQKGIPEQASEAAAEGTLLHAAVATGNMDGLTEEQKDLVQQCIDFREKLMRENNMRHYGSEVHLQVFKGPKLLTEGYADDVLVRYKEGTNIVEHVIVIDYKFGEKESNAYKEQVRGYMRSINEMGYAVSGYICYCRLKKVVAVPLR